MSKNLIPKVEYFSTTEQLKLAAADESSKSCQSYAENCFLILSVINLPDISQFEG